MKSLDNKKMVPFILFVFMVLGLWSYGSLISNSMIRMDGVFLGDGFPLIGGDYANDWFRFLMACAFAVGWLFVFMMFASKNIDILKRIVYVTALLVVVGILMLSIIFKLDPASLEREFLNGFLMSFLYGCILGSPTTMLRHYFQS